MLNQLRIKNKKFLYKSKAYKPNQGSLKMTRYENYRVIPNNPGAFMRSKILKVSQFQNEFMKSSFLPKYERKIVRISALCSKAEILTIFVSTLRETMTC